jgi:signal transduction histidine kinase
MPDFPAARILIVDDEAPQMQALCHTLGDHGYVTTGFTSARQALDCLQKQEFDLLLTDLMMPEMDGISLLRAALEADRNLVAVMMTGHGTIDTAVAAMQAGALDYILKPFKLSVALPVLVRALGVRRLRVENTALARCVQDRTIELETANRDLESFSYSISHDLRAPLRHIEGYTGILLQDFSTQMPDEARRLLKIVGDCSQKMEQLIDDLLRFSRLGRQSLSKQPVDISALVQQVCEELCQEQPDRTIEIKMGELPDGVGDRALLKQVFINLLSNAFKFTRQKEKAWVEIKGERRDGENIYWVRDNGAGFDLRFAEKLFGVFQRFHHADQFEGTGVGLSIVHRIIQRHGGRIWAEAEVDKGATFYFSLPH